nr:radical SAM protein [Bacteroidota bacterium]
IQPRTSSPLLTAESKKRVLPKRQEIITGIRKEIIEVLIRLEVLGLIIRHYPNPFTWLKVFQAMDPHRKSILGNRRVKKIAKVEGKYYWGAYIPAWPTDIFHDFLKAELHRVYQISSKTNRLTNIYLAITNKCPLQCDHCYEWDALNKKEKSSLDGLKNIVKKFQAEGVSQIHLSGGEPLVKIKDVIELLQTSKKNSEFWVLTSGFNLSMENALSLRRAGLSGVMISLDHYDAEWHNMFRGFENAYTGAIDGARNSISAGLVTVLNLCVTKAFVSEDNLMKYMELAQNLGVAFVQFLEPRAVGHYKGQNVDLTREQELIVEEFYIKMNYDDLYKDYPAVCYHGYHQRRMGCHAAGKRSVYIDTVGDVHACPFCQAATGNAHTDDIHGCMGTLQKTGCHKFS